MAKDITITVYCADQICASCVGAPGSRDTYEWLQAAIGSKYVEDDIKYTYIDISHKQDDSANQAFVDRIYEEDLFYPIVFVNYEMVGKGIPKMKTIFQEVDKRGIELQEA